MQELCVEYMLGDLFKSFCNELQLFRNTNDSFLQAKYVKLINAEFQF